MLTFRRSVSSSAPGPLAPADLTNAKPLKRYEMLLVTYGRRRSILLVALWLLGLVCTSIGGVLPRPVFFALLAVAVVSYGSAAAIMRHTVRRHSAIPPADMQMLHSLYRLGVPWPIGYAASRPDAVRAFDAVNTEIVAMRSLDDVDGDVRWRIVSELVRNRAHALAMLAFMLEDPKVAERIPALVAERATTDPLRIHSLLTAVAPGTEGTLGAGAL